MSMDAGQMKALKGERQDRKMGDNHMCEKSQEFFEMNDVQQVAVSCLPKASTPKKDVGIGDGRWWKKIREEEEDDSENQLTSQNQVQC